MTVRKGRRIWDTWRGGRSSDLHYHLIWQMGWLLRMGRIYTPRRAFLSLGHMSRSQRPGALSSPFLWRIRVQSSSSGSASTSSILNYRSFWQILIHNFCHAPRWTICLDTIVKIMCLDFIKWPTIWNRGSIFFHEAVDWVLAWKLEHTGCNFRGIITV